MCMELLGVEGIGFFLYIDDVVAIFPSKEAVFNAVHVALPMRTHRIFKIYNAVCTRYSVALLINN